MTCHARLLCMHQLSCLPVNYENVYKVLGRLTSTSLPLHKAVHIPCTLPATSASLLRDPSVRTPAACTSGCAIKELCLKAPQHPTMAARHKKCCLLLSSWALALCKSWAGILTKMAAQTSAKHATWLTGHSCPLLPAASMAASLKRPVCLSLLGKAASSILHRSSCSRCCRDRLAVRCCSQKLRFCCIL